MDAPRPTQADRVDHAGDHVGDHSDGSPPAVVVRWGDPAEALAVARREAWQLPVLRFGRRVRRVPSTWEGVALRLQAALWEVAARADIAVGAGASIDDVTRRLVGAGAIAAPAGEAVRALGALAGAGCVEAWTPDVSSVAVAEAARLAERLAGHLALRARFG